jgi:hypothetical protein
MPLTTLFVALVALGLLLGAASLLALRTSGASPSVARRLAGPPELKVGRLLDDGELPLRPVRITGRIRCREPLDAGDGERLVAFHRDVEVRIGSTWRSVERMRETRSFELWDHDGSVTLDPAAAAEPLISIPHVWRGSPDELEEPHASVAARLAERHGPIAEARAITRSINVTDRLLVLGIPSRDDQGRARIDPPNGGYLLSNLALDDAMRLLGGRHRRAAAAGVVGIGISIALIAIGGVGALVSAVIS